ncbi:MAG: L-ascorbate metabolism protein UlaG (beta-lactamase superfamily) [Alteromonadaceae bacterium]|jgi:L-ascorbate metabolism protein UlaG (beta-lactamase superfamily)
MGHIFVSHYHHDHFNAKDTVTYLKSAPQVKLFAPKQAVDKLNTQPEYPKIADQIISLSLGINDQTKHVDVNGMQIDMLRVPHAFGDKMKGVENIIYRVTMENGLTVMHFGDAETSLDYYKKFKMFFQEKTTHHVFLPHIFAINEHDENAIKETFNANAITYMHVPISFLSDTMIDKKDFFTKPNDKRIIRK